uniref:Carbon starvation protein A n=1 Tax=Steinernema glaseri TaxID=37863 RepID=A0A1I8ADK0_9BILA
VNARYIGYGGMLMESFVAIMAMVAASVIEPGVYFAMNSPAAVVGADVVSVAQTILHQVLPGENTMAFWYHFAILFEALFILTAVDAGTRAGRFMLQDLLGSFVPALKRTESWGANLLATAGCVAFAALDAGQVLAPAKDIAQMQHVIFNAYTNATLTALFLFVVFSILFFALKVGIRALNKKERTDKESPFQALPDA